MKTTTKRVTPSTAAVEYAKRGCLVFPVYGIVGDKCSCTSVDCTSPGKHPRTANGHLNATNDLKQLRDWWRRWPRANVAIRTGRESGWVALDVDGARGAASLAKMEHRYGNLPVTAKSRTGNGLHFIFAHPMFCGVPNSQGRIAPGIDVRGDGGYIVVPPSVNLKGPYEWILPPSETALAAIPAWLLPLMTQPKSQHGVACQ